ncbi:diguanylate cyclase [Devosia sp.]|uniref:diguanylate cyclase domain-containing protein n=1 Tax=Devosia sp. TaxID=1871048 RepID=UPI001AD55207|nr:diguanylate cyclase [Devosia sp.]MBN9333054.1 diguanylate cyclase [Devosia sp.]
MAKSWFSWFDGKNEDTADRRAVVPRPLIDIGPDDIDPITGALYWDRFQTMLDAEQAQAPGVLLVIDLSERSNRVRNDDHDKTAEILPWLAQAIRQAVRSDDLLAHVDGFRFAVLLRGAPQQAGQATCDRILESVDNTIFMTAGGISRLGVTIGGAVFETDGGREAFATATKALDRAKRSEQHALLQ